MNSISKLTVNYHNRKVGTLSMTPDNRLCAFQYDKEWLANGFSILKKMSLGCMRTSKLIFLALKILFGKIQIDFL